MEKIEYTPQKLREMIQAVLAAENDMEESKLIIRLRSDMFVAFKKSELTEDRKQFFIECMKKIPKIKDGLSYISMAGNDEFWLDQRDAIVCQALGRAYDLWKIFPADIFPKEEDMIEVEASDRIGMLPLNTGLKIDAGN